MERFLCFRYSTGTMKALLVVVYVALLGSYSLFVFMSSLVHFLRAVYFLTLALYLSRMPRYAYQPTPHFVPSFKDGLLPHCPRVHHGPARSQ